jgi:hypothetical protein
MATLTVPPEPQKRRDARGTARSAGDRHRDGRDGRDDVDQRHEAVVLVVEAVAVHDEEAGIVLERVRIKSVPGCITDSSGPRFGAVTLALSMPCITGPSLRPMVGSETPVIWKSLTWMWMGCSSLFSLRNTHSSTELSRGWRIGTFGKAPLSKAYMKVFGSDVLARSLRKPPLMRMWRVSFQP